MRQLNLLLATGVALTLLGVARADSPTPFTTIVRAHWKEWGGTNGTIAPDQLDRLMKQRKIRGEAAAALATLKLRENDPQTKQPITWTRAHIESYESPVAQQKNQNTFDKTYKKPWPSFRRTRMCCTLRRTALEQHPSGFAMAIAGCWRRSAP